MRIITVCLLNRPMMVNYLTSCMRDAGYEVDSWGAEVAGHEVASGATTVSRLSAAHPSHVHVGLQRATDITSCAARPLDDGNIRRQPVSAAATGRQTSARRLPERRTVSRPRVGTSGRTGSSSTHGRRLGSHGHRQMTTHQPDPRPLPEERCIFSLTL